MLKTNQLIGFGGRPQVSEEPPPVGDTPVYPGYLFVPTDGSHFMNWTKGSAGNLRQWTLSWWQYQDLSSGNSNIYSHNQSGSDDIKLHSSGYLRWIQNFGSLAQPPNSTTGSNVWTHVVWAANADATTGPEALRAYFDGVEQLTWAVDNRANVANGYDWVGIAGGGEQQWGAARNTQTPVPFRISDIYYIDGQTLDATAFGFDDSGTWRPKEYTGTYGTNGYHLCTEDSVAADYHLDQSPSNNDWARNSLDDGDWSAVDGPGGNPPGTWDPTHLTNLTAWYDASDDSTVTIQTGVSQLDDKSGNGYHLLQASAGAQPVYSDVDDTITFDGVDDSLLVAITHSGTELHYYMVATLKATGDAWGRFMSGVINENDYNNPGVVILQHINDTDNLRCFENNTQLSVTADNPLATETTSVWQVSCSGGSNTLERDQSAYPAVSMTQSTITNTHIVLGEEQHNALNSAMELNELIYCNGSVSGAEETEIYNYLNTKWSLP